MKKDNSWAERIAQAETFMNSAHEHGRKVYNRYADEREDDIGGAEKKANFFYANVNTQKESLYNSPPKADVSRLNKGNYDDDVARVASLILQRVLNYEVECAESFEEAVSAAILDRLVPGLGQVWVRFDADPDNPGSEKIFLDPVYWEDFLYGPARTWNAVPWVARRLLLDKDEMKKRFGVEEGEGVANEDNTPEEITSGKTAVYEIWDKKTKKVIFITKGREAPLKVVSDPYKLKKFFPCPKPLIANPTTKKFLPITDYHIAQDQYLQLDTLYGRIQLIVEAIRVAGLYDSAATEIARMLQGAENTLIPVDNWAMFAERGGTKGLIEWYPVEQVAMVLQQLVAQFEMSKSVLYEITGMSDIVRGASNQYETAAAQQIKAQFASVRLDGTQRQVAKFVRDVLRIIVGVVSTLYSDQKIAAIVGNVSEPDAPYVAQAMQVIRSPELSSYKVDVEASSLTQADWALEKGQRMEIIGAMAQMISAAAPLIAQAPEMGILTSQMMKFAVAGFKGSAEIEGWLDQQIDVMKKKAQQPQPKQPSPEEIKAQSEQQKIQMEMQASQQEHQMEAQKSQQEMAMEQQRMQAELAFKEKEMQMDIQMKQMDIRMKEIEMQLKMREAQMNMQVEAQRNAMEMTRSVQQGEVDAQLGQQKLQQSAAAGAQKLDLAKKAAAVKPKTPRKRK
jgi:hypothetical protein